MLLHLKQQTKLATCLVCQSLLEPNHLSKCCTCKMRFCSRCSCPCDRPTSDSALSAALTFLGCDLQPKAWQTVVVEDECGVHFGLDGVREFLTREPRWEQDIFADCIPTLVAASHKEAQRRAIKDGQAVYIADGWCGAFRRFDIADRVFTVCVLDVGVAA